MRFIKVIFVLIFSVFLLTGCNNLMNNPTKKVELLLSKYQKKDEEVIKQLSDTLLSDTVLNDAEKNTYKELLERQYSDLTYKIKDEAIDGNTSVVEVEIEVYDYNKAVSDAEDYLVSHQDEFMGEDNTISTEKYNDYKLNAIKNMNDRIKYTINFTLSKIDEEWMVDDLTDVERKKIHGLYAY